MKLEGSNGLAVPAAAGAAATKSKYEPAPAGALELEDEHEDQPPRSSSSNSSPSIRLQSSAGSSAISDTVSNSSQTILDAGGGEGGGGGRPGGGGGAGKFHHGEVDTFEDLLRICGDGSWWQLKVFMLTSFCGFLTALHNLSYAFIGAIPPHWCQLPSIPGLSPETVKNYTIPLDKDSEYEECRRYHFLRDTNFTSDFSFVDRNHTETCPKVEFDRSIFDSTVVTEWDLVCGREAWASSVQAMYMFGILVGSPIFGAVSDRLGRKKAILISSIIFIITGPVVAFVQDFKWLMFVRFVLGFSTPGIYGTSFVLMVEVIGPAWRGLAGNLFCLPFATGYMVLAGVAYLVREWRILQLVISAPSILQIVVYWLLPESPRWLLRKGRAGEAEDILRNVAKWNGRQEKLPINFRQLVEHVGAAEKEEVLTASFGAKLRGVLVGYTKLLRTTQMRKRTLIIYFSWASISMVYYGVALNSPNLSADRYLYTFISGILEIPSYFMVPPLIKWLGRRPSFSGFLLLCGASLLSSLLLAEKSVGIIVLAMVGKLLIGSAYALVYLYATELMPTLLRSYGVGTSSMIGRIGSVSAPYIVDLIGRGNKTYPTVIFGTVSLLAGILSLMLPETSNRRLPETVEEVECKTRSLEIHY